MKIVILDGYTSNPGDISWEPVERLGQLVVYNQTSPHQIEDRAHDAEVIVTNKVALNAEILKRLPKLRFISVLATGYDVVDIEAARKQGVVVSNVPEYSTRSVAQHVFAGLLALLNRPEHHHQAITEGRWAVADQFAFWDVPLIELAGKTMGIVGMGRIGSAVARLANAFGMQVLATSRQPKVVDGLEIRWLTLDELFAHSDFISLHCPATAETKHFVDSRLISKMKPTAVLINTARGVLINEAELATALNAGRIAGAFLDVVSREPIEPDNPLLRAKNCLLTPHQAWATLESRGRLIAKTAENIAAYQAGKCIHRVN